MAQNTDSSEKPKPLITTLINTKNNFITAYGPKSRFRLNFNDPSRTRQSFKDECNINIIMSRYMKTGVLDFVNKHQGQYGDITGLEYQTAMQQIASAQSLFQELPSNIRSRFDNDPREFLEFVHDPDNASEMHELALMRPDYQPASLAATTLPLTNPQAPGSRSAPPNASLVQPPKAESASITT